MRGSRGPLRGVFCLSSGGMRCAGRARVRMGGRVRRLCFLEGLLAPSQRKFEAITGL
jgi:hypothetical protein